MSLNVIEVMPGVYGKVVMTCLLATLIQASLHYVLGHHRPGGRFFAATASATTAIHSGSKLAT